MILHDGAFRCGHIILDQIGSTSSPNWQDDTQENGLVRLIRFPIPR